MGPSLQGSDYLDVVHGKVAGRPPRPDLRGGERGFRSRPSDDPFRAR